MPGESGIYPLDLWAKKASWGVRVANQGRLLKPNGSGDARATITTTLAEMQLLDDCYYYRDCKLESTTAATVHGL